MSDEFPADLVERCAQVAGELANARWPESRHEIAIAVLRASKHAELVAALKAIEPVHDNKGNLTLKTAHYYKANGFWWVIRPGERCGRNDSFSDYLMGRVS